MIYKARKTVYISLVLVQIDFRPWRYENSGLSFLGDEETIKEDEQSTTSYTFCSHHTLKILDISDDGILFLCVVWCGFTTFFSQEIDFITLCGGAWICKWHARGSQP